MSTREYRNPIIAGFAPDPSCIQVDGVYYLVNSSFYAFPGLPIYSSTDLQNWSHINNAINDIEQLSLEGALTDAFPMGPEKLLVACQGLLAPSIRYHKGTFYVICTNTSSDGNDLQYANFYVKTTDIYSGKWSAPIYFDFRGIDPSLFFDDDERAYIQGSYRAGPVWDPKCTIGQFEVDIETGKSLSDIKHIWKGAFGKQDAEGPHMYKKDDYYYLIAAEDGTFEHHAITMARSKSVWGPFESCPKNPLLCAYGTKETIQHTGHGDLFQSADGQWWCVCLGVRNVGGRYPLSRETFLTPVEWPTNDWPSISQPKPTFERRVTLQDGLVLPALSNHARLEDVYIRTPDLENFRIGENIIHIKPGACGLATRSGKPSFLGERQRAVESSASVQLNLSAIASHTSITAGLAIYKDERRHACLKINPQKAMIVVQLTTHRTAPRVVTQQSIDLDGLINLRIQATESTYIFSYLRGACASEWHTLASIDTNELSTYDFTGPLFGVFAHAESQDSDLPAVAFKDFSVV